MINTSKHEQQYNLYLFHVVKHFFICYLQYCSERNCSRIAIAMFGGLKTRYAARMICVWQMSMRCCRNWLRNKCNFYFLSHNSMSGFNDPFFLKLVFLKWDDKRVCKELQKLWASQIDV